MEYLEGLAEETAALYDEHGNERPRHQHEEPDITPEDEAILDAIWDKRIKEQQAKLRDQTEKR